MSYVTSSYVSDVSQAILDRLETMLGEGSTVFPEPIYLLLKTFGRTGGFGIQEYPDDKQPVALVHYFHGVSDSVELGRAGRGTGKDFWQVYVGIRFTRDRIGYAGEDVQYFRRICEASATLLLARMMTVLAGWPPSVQCAITGKKSMYPKVEGWGANPVATGDWSMSYNVQLAYTLPFEH